MLDTRIEGREPRAVRLLRRHRGFPPGVVAGGLGEFGSNPPLKARRAWISHLAMSTVQEIESALIRLTTEEREAVRDWLNDLAEAQVEVSDAFKAKIGRAREELARGEVSRVRQAPGAPR